VFSGLYPSFKFRPGDFTIFFTVAFVKRGFINNGSFSWAAWQGVIGYCSFNRAGFHAFDFVPFGAEESDSGPLPSAASYDNN